MSAEVWKCPFCEEKPAVAHCTLTVEKAAGGAVEAYLQEGCALSGVPLCVYKKYVQMPDILVRTFRFF